MITVQTVYLCDQCLCEEEDREQALDWITVEYGENPNVFSPDPLYRRHFCSWECVAEWARCCRCEKDGPVVLGPYNLKSSILTLGSSE